MPIDADRLARALHAYHLDQGGQAPWNGLPEPAREIYRKWALKVAELYDRTEPVEGGEDHG